MVGQHEAEEAAQHLREVQALRTRRNTRITARMSKSGSVPAGVTSKTIHFVRHGQGVHNVAAEIGVGCDCRPPGNGSQCAYKDPSLHDAKLTEIGEGQARRLLFTSRDLPLDLVVVSPLSRAVQTALLAFQQPHGRFVPFVANELIREQHGVHVCDKRSSRTVLESSYPDVDFGALNSEVDLVFREDVRESREDVAQRCYELALWLRQRPEKHIGVVGHSSWLLTMFNAVLECDDPDTTGKWFGTGEMRSVIVDWVDQDSRSSRAKEKCSYTVWSVLSLAVMVSTTAALLWHRSCKHSKQQ